MGVENITVLIVEPGKKPYEKSIPPNLESLQREVGGYIQAIYPWDDPCAIVCDEEGKVKHNPYNRVLWDEDGDIYDVIAGTFLIVGLGEESFVSLDKKHIKEYSELFATPEEFLKHGDYLIIVS